MNLLRFLPRRHSSAASASISKAAATVSSETRSAVRILWVGGLVIAGLTLAYAAIIARIAQLQMMPPQQVASLTNTQYATETLQARRGPILDRRGRILASSDTYLRLYVDPQSVEDPGIFPERLSAALGYDSAFVARAISQRPDSRFVLIDPRVSDERAAKLLQLRLTGVGTETRLERKYAMGTMAGQVLGFAGFDGKGLEGLERTLESTLAGTPGKMVVLRDAARRPLGVDPARYVAPVDGQSVRLAIDATIQVIAEDELNETCTKYGAQAGQMVVMNPVTGEVLAMVNWPKFDPNDVARSTPDLRRNRCITDFFEPGSIAKPYTWAAALQMGLIKPNENIDCGPGLWVMQSGRKLHDAHPAGMQTATGVLIKSSNIGMGKIGERLGAQRLRQAVSAFGFGQEPGSELAGESAGMLNRLQRWTPYSVTSIPMGQEIGVTPLQITRAFCTFANGGLLVRPTILARNPADLTTPARLYVGRVLTPEVANLTRQVMRQVVTEGTGKKAESDLYTIFGKTGTAQMVDHARGGYLPGGYVASFTAGAPVGRPQIVVGCFIHHPDPAKGHFGGIVSAPAVKNVIEQSLLYLGVAPDQQPKLDAQGHILRTNAPVDARE